MRSKKTPPSWVECSSVPPYHRNDSLFIFRGSWWIFTLNSEWTSKLHVSEQPDVQDNCRRKFECQWNRVTPKLCLHTPPKTKMEPENIPLEKEKHLPKPPTFPNHQLLGSIPKPPTFGFHPGCISVNYISCTYTVTMRNFEFLDWIWNCFRFFWLLHPSTWAVESWKVSLQTWTSGSLPSEIMSQYRGNAKTQKHWVDILFLPFDHGSFPNGFLQGLFPLQWGHVPLLWLWKEGKSSANTHWILDSGTQQVKQKWKILWIYSLLVTVTTRIFGFF